MIQQEIIGIQSKIIQAHGNINLYKIFGEQTFTFNKAQYEVKVDWSGFYTQLTPQHSMRYLTKKWDDGSDHASLVSFQIISKQLMIMELKHSLLGSPTISGYVKAEAIKKHLRETYADMKNLTKQKLLEYLGQKQTLLLCIDSQDEQIIIPHSLLNQKYLQFKNLYSFKRSNDGMLRTISYCQINQKKQWKKMPKQFQFEPYLFVLSPLFINPF